MSLKRVTKGVILAISYALRQQEIAKKRREYVNIMKKAQVNLTRGLESTILPL